MSVLLLISGCIRSDFPYLFFFNRYCASMQRSFQKKRKHRSPIHVLTKTIKVHVCLRKALDTPYTHQLASEIHVQC